MEGQTLLTGYLSVTPSPSISPSSSVPNTPQSTVLEITDESEHEEDEISSSIRIKDSGASTSPDAVETLGRTRLGTARILTLADNGSESADDETDEEVNELIRGDNETSHRVDGDWRELRNKIDKLLAKQKKAVTMRLTEVSSRLL